MELASGYTAKNQNKAKHVHGGRMGLDSPDTLLVIKLPDSMVLRIISRSIFLALVLLTLPCIESIFRGLSVPELDTESEIFDFEQLGLLFHDLAGEGLRRKGDKALIVNPGNAGMTYNLHRFDNNGFDDFDIVIDSDLERKSSFSDESLDFVFAFNLVDAKFVDRIVKIGGIVAVPISNDPSNAFRQKSNYRIVYLRRYASTFVALRKTGPADESTVVKSRRLCQLETETKKKAALEGLEDVFLEPPRRALAKSNKHLKKIKFLPDLLGDSLESYRRRVFINMGLNEENSGVVEWFHRNYPKMNKEFEVHNIEVVPEEASSTVPRQLDGVSDWLKRNVREEDYVVMKAESEVVVEMMKNSAICLVDELFLECNNEWWQNGKEGNKSKRAYWECIALYGRLRDLGVAVHQWFL